MNKIFTPDKIKKIRRYSVIMGLSMLVMVSLAQADDDDEEDEEREAKKEVIVGDAYLGQRFNDKTKLFPDKRIATQLKELSAGVGAYKKYEGSETIKLPGAGYKGMVLEDAFKKRRSIRSEDDFSEERLSIEELSQLLFAANGITGRDEASGYDLRTSPSAGALHPVEIYVVANRVSGIDEGLYHYSALDHSLELIRKGDLRKEITFASDEQEEADRAGAVLILTAVTERTTKKYDVRGYRYMYIEAGCISQNIYLEAVSLGLVSTAMGAFYDDELSKFLGIDGRKEVPVHLHAVGKGKVTS